MTNSLKPLFPLIDVGVTNNSAQLKQNKNVMRNLLFSQIDKSLRSLNEKEIRMFSRYAICFMTNCCVMHLKLNRRIYIKWKMKSTTTSATRDNKSIGNIVCTNVSFAFQQHKFFQSMASIFQLEKVIWIRHLTLLHTFRQFPGISVLASSRLSFILKIVCAIWYDQLAFIWLLWNKCKQ